MLIHNIVKLFAGTTLGIIYIVGLSMSDKFESVDVQNGNCKLSNIVKNHSFFTPDEYTYRCDNDISFTVDFKVL